MTYSDSRSMRSCWALLGAFEFEKGRVRKRVDFAAMDRLHEDGYITDPHGKKESVRLAVRRLTLAKQLAARHLAQ
jgi:hypothetical protein